MQTLKAQKHLLSWGTLLFLVTMLSSCGQPLFPYQPEVNLDKSTYTINKTITVKEFKDNRIKKEKRRNEFSLIHPPHFKKKLSTEITNAVRNDFSNNLVFRKVDQQLDSADYFVVGEITDFNSSVKPTTSATISVYSIVGIIITPFIGINVNKMEAKIDLTMKIYSKDGQLIGTYSGNSYAIDRASIYNRKKVYNFPKRTNESFSNVVGQIRAQIIKDASKFNN